MGTQTDLYHQLAETSIRADRILDLHRQSFERLPQRQEAMLQELQQLSQQIEAQGVGANPQAEDRYLDLLESYRYLDNSYDLGLKLHGRNMPLQKAAGLSDIDKRTIAYGALLLTVYRQGVLVKGATDDLQYWADKLSAIADNGAKEIAAKLRQQIDD